ncbi:MAG: MarR family transcriptional regulator [Candidatus Eremiobacteraeota bacterium]|nr:MarR family transcriptional regulator [Candidatus Eremiobacteraeota bacterium]
MSTTKVTVAPSLAPVNPAALFLPEVQAVIEAGEHLMEQLCSIAMSQGLASKGLAVAIWRLHLHKSALKVTDLAQHIDCDTGNTSGIIDRLEEMGLVERVQRGDDRRVRLVQLTPKGRKLGAHMEHDYRNSWIYREFNELNPRERSAFNAVLGRLNLAANRPA